MTFDLNNVSESAVRVQVSVGGERALDVQLPAGAGCAHPPVYSYSFALPTNRVDVEVSTSQDQHGSVRLNVTNRHRWVVVMVQDGFPLTVDGHWKSAPQWG